jgi:hypothetical protein
MSRVGSVTARLDEFSLKRLIDEGVRNYHAQ